MRRHLLVAVLVAAIGAVPVACDGDGDDAKSVEVPNLEGELAVDADRADECDPIDPRACLLPFPNDFFTVEDDTATGRRVAFPESAMPVNADGKPIDPTEWNRNDGFSPGAMIMAFVPGLDAERSKVAPSTDNGASLADDSPVVLVDAETGERIPTFAELDSNATSDDNRLLIVHPAVTLQEGDRHVVALRNLVDDGGDAIEPSDAFRAYRDLLDTGDDTLEDRRPAMEQVFADLDEAGVGRDDLYLAWDFTVASADSLAGRVLHMRDDAFDELDDHAPDFTVESAEDSGAARVVRGTFESPSYLAGDGGPGSFLNNGDGDDDPLPERNGTITANFVCTVPTAATADDPPRWALFGHGLLGSADEVLNVGTVAAGVNAGFCATDWIGMSEQDLAFLPDAIADMTLWRATPDRLQQSFVNFMVLGKLLLAGDGLGSDETFQDADGESLVDGDRELFFVGGSQGGILGGAVSAVATDWNRAFLAVPGINYSLLLDRSSQYDQFEPLFKDAYPDEVEQQLTIGIIQMLWDRGENDAYAQHLTRDPYHDTPAKKILLFEAFGDHQVANVSTETLARSIGAGVRAPPPADGRSPAVEPFFDIDPVTEFPFDGKALLVVWDYGTPAPPPGNTRPTQGADPHGFILMTIPAILMANDFLMPDGVVTDPCEGEPCRS